MIIYVTRLKRKWLDNRHNMQRKNEVVIGQNQLFSVEGTMSAWEFSDIIRKYSGNLRVHTGTFHTDVAPSAAGAGVTVVVVLAP